MAWDFETEPEFQEKLDWMEEFVREEIEPIGLVWSKSTDPFDVHNDKTRALIKPLQEEVRKRGLWACHLTPDLGGQGYGQLKLALMNEILGRSQWASRVFGTQAPDTGNAEIIAHYGTPEQKRKYLQPLLDGEMVSCYSMTEPRGGSDPAQFRCRAWREGDEWVLDGEKYYSSHADFAEFLIVMAVTDPDVPVYQGTTMFLVPRDTPGIEILRNVGLMHESLDEPGSHGWVRYNKVRLPADAVLGEPGKAFELAQKRLGGGRIHHAMRTVAYCKRALDMMCERSLSRFTQGSLLSEKQSIQNYIADSFIELEQFRLLVLYAAWWCDKGDRHKSRIYISAVKVQAAEVLHDIVRRSVQVHGALGCSNETPLAGMWMTVPTMGVMDGPTEVHRITVAKQVLRRYKPSDDPLWPSEWLPAKREAAQRKFADYLEDTVGNL
ncbi:MAG: acyl-CoA dehydrogenase family protein [Halioglobus sp.]|nr:acyl-CoA dehydrogenase family protein [Halioglobus sp.]